MDAAKLKAVKLIQENKIMVFSKIGCPYCDHTKQLLKDVVGPGAFEVLEVAGGNVGQDNRTLLFS